MTPPFMVGELSPHEVGFKRGRDEYYQDCCEGIPQDAVKESGLVVPDYIPFAQWSGWVAGYASCLEADFGPNWRSVLATNRAYKGDWKNRLHHGLQTKPDPSPQLSPVAQPSECEYDPLDELMQT